MSHEEGEQEGAALSGVEMIRRLFDGYTSQQIAEWMMDQEYWPALKPSSAAARVRACCDPNKDEFWKLSELVGWAEYTGRRALADYVCDHTPGIGRPAGEESISEAMRGLLEQLDEAERARDRLIRSIHEQSAREGMSASFETAEGEAFGTPASVRHVRFHRG